MSRKKTELKKLFANKRSSKSDFRTEKRVKEKPIAVQFRNC